MMPSGFLVNCFFKKMGGGFVRRQWGKGFGGGGQKRVSLSLHALVKNE
jgi:hypothetical protein